MSRRETDERVLTNANDERRDRHSFPPSQSITDERSDEGSSESTDGEKTDDEP